MERTRGVPLDRGEPAGLERHLLFTFSSAVEPEIRSFLKQPQPALPGEAL